MANGNPSSQTPANPQYYTLETLRNITTAAAAITLVCGLIMNFYKQGTNHEIGFFLINSIALTLCVSVVLANQYQRDTLLNKAQHILLIFFNSVLLYASVAGATGITSAFKNAPKAAEKHASIFSFLLPTRPLYGITEDVYDATKNSLDNANQIIGATRDLALKRNDTLITTVINANSGNVKSTPKETTTQIQTISLQKLDTIYSSVNTYWVYVGQIINAKWQPQNFAFIETPQKGDEMTASNSVYKRDAQPVKLSDDDWRLGKVIGVISRGQKLKVVDMVKIEDDNYWARVSDQ